MTAPRWFFRFMYDRESAAWERRRDGPGHRKLVKRIADELPNVVAPPGPVADLGCGPGAHALALARRGYQGDGIPPWPAAVAMAAQVDSEHRPAGIQLCRDQVPVAGRRARAG
jgi:SAM-dependent methyltransferase